MNDQEMTRESELETISGTVETIIFENRDNGYTVFDISSDEGNDIITARNLRDASIRPSPLIYRRPPCRA